MDHKMLNLAGSVILVLSGSFVLLSSAGCGCGKKKQPEPAVMDTKKSEEIKSSSLIDKPITNMIQRMEFPAYTGLLKQSAQKRTQLNVRMAQTQKKLRERREFIMSESKEAQKKHEKIKDLHEKVSELEKELDKIVLEDPEYATLKAEEADELKELAEITREAQHIVQAGMRSADESLINKPKKRKWEANTNGLVYAEVDTNALARSKSISATVIQKQAESIKGQKKADK